MRINAQHVQFEFFRPLLVNGQSDGGCRFGFNIDAVARYIGTPCLHRRKNRMLVFPRLNRSLIMKGLRTYHDVVVKVVVEISDADVAPKSG